MKSTFRNTPCQSISGTKANVPKNPNKPAYERRHLNSRTVPSIVSGANQVKTHQKSASQVLSFKPQLMLEVASQVQINRFLQQGPACVFTGKHTLQWGATLLLSPATSICAGHGAVICFAQCFVQDKSSYRPMFSFPGGEREVKGPITCARGGRWNLIQPRWISLAPTLGARE